MAERKTNKSGKYRVSVSLSEKMFNRIKEDADMLGLSPGVYINQVVGIYYQQLDSNKDTVKKVLTEGFSKMFENLNLPAEFTQKVIDESMDESVDDLQKLLMKK